MINRARSMRVVRVVAHLGGAAVLGLFSGWGCGGGDATFAAGPTSHDAGGTSTGSTGGGTSTTGSIILVEGGPNSDAGEKEASTTCHDEGGCIGTMSDAGPVCGDGIVTAPSETCDDGNPLAGDGCSGLCRIEPNFTCPTPGMPCVSTIICGDGVVTGNEACDDMNTVAGDGCSADCKQVETGFACTTPGQPCVPTTTPAQCGNAQVEGGETCDDGNMAAGDGCSANCQREAGWHCPTPGQPCVQDQFCGDGKLADNEQCDDGNTKLGDGCDAACNLEDGYTCPTEGQPCVAVCGDGKVRGAETCDDGNTTPGDGCSADCKVEAGHTCPATGGACFACGDGQLNASNGEQCDDGNAKGGDGCSAQCLIEANYSCPVAGQPCVSLVVCGDGKVTGNETCDDKNTNADDGCSPTCQVEPGWVCPAGGVCRAAECGDGIRAGFEKCDDGNTAGGDGCSSTCEIEPGFACGADTWHPTAAPTDCYRTTCGDGHQEGLEQCDDGNNRPFDGCAVDCTNEPKCGYPNGDINQPYGCSAVCGDGIKFPSEACDDGNTQDGDGCSSSCQIEPGYTCNASAPALGDSLTLPIIYRDFPYSHPQFEVQPDPNGFDGNVRQAGIASAKLGVNGKPTFNAAYIGIDADGNSFGRPWTMDGPAMNTTGPQMEDAQGNVFRTKAANNTASLTADQIAQRFADWYTDDSTGATRKTIQSTLTLVRQTNGTYQFPEDAATKGTDFFPLDGQGFGDLTDPAGCTPGTTNCTNHNFHFTSELRYWFQYAGGEQLFFHGDDDVWVFVNGQLAVDLGGIHSELRGVVTLNGASSQIYEDQTPCPVVNRVSECGSATNFANIDPANIAGDPNVANIVSDIANLNLTVGGIYEIVVFQAERHVTGSNYELTLKGFNAPRSTCTPVCGDGIVTKGEACDLGSDKNTGAYGTCNPNCTLPASCGDGIVQADQGEQCDNGLNVDTYATTASACAPGCKKPPFCGDGMIDASHGEACDDGTANNTGAYNGCTATCSRAPYCGDGAVQADAGEQCDDGKNDGSYGTCAPGCVRGPYCGDGIVQPDTTEVCDLGSENSDTAYGPGKCTAICRPAPFCGDKQVDADHGEKCDDGKNDGTPGSCLSDCSGFVPLPSCGDHVVQAPEQCDDGSGSAPTNNGGTQSTCDARCRFKCGNGVVDPGEECDDGKNDGSYGTCNANCTRAPYCGDGVKNGTEQCDNGPNNSADAYGQGLCTNLCTYAPFCGDGYIHPPQEQCDGTPGCGGDCIIIGVQ